MTGERRVLVRADTRTVSVTIDDAHAEFQYAGVTVQRLENSDVVEQIWVLLGASPTYADDEALVDALHSALRWNWVGSQA
ncbi:hypothetical protein [Amycolatopsis sp. RTGN1]|uniref:hypothetical protein n=1 Tax=Amycolatopsis ponsaeliensis TaxID=2992142 RepID=UPI00254B70F6|nr:hypothetical protein [Amycolatopsis sp. RTGN1]